MFAAVGDGGTILTSPTGTSSWTPTTSPTSNDLVSIAWSGTQFVAADALGTIYTSSTGTAW
jgi:hypothetical protein